MSRDLKQNEQALALVATILDQAIVALGQTTATASDLVRRKKHALIINDNGNLKIIFLTKHKHTLGRSQTSDIQFKSKGVSRSHATLYAAQNFYYIIDGTLEGSVSTNGLLINNKRRQSCQLKQGDIITFCPDASGLFLEFASEAEDRAQQRLIEQILEFCLPDHQSALQPVSQTILNILPDLILYFDATGIILDLKEAQDPELSHYSQEFIHASLAQCFSPKVAHQMLAAAKQAYATRAPQTFDCELTYNHNLVTFEIWISLHVDDSFVGIIRNISRRKAVEHQLMHDVLHDTLTGLPNRRHFSQQVEQAIRSHGQEDNLQFAVLHIDLDRFKMINDSMGHSIGDRFIAEIAKRLTSCLRDCDMAARLGDDDFAVLINRLHGVEEATGVARRLLEQLSKPLQFKKYDWLPSATIGIALSSPKYQTAAEILRDADIAMYQAKASGESSFELFNRGMHQKAVQRLKLDSDLRRAIRRQEFQLYYQPIVSLKGQELVGFESLIRWFHPKRGFVSPEVFIQMSEETGLIEPLSEWVLDQACYQLSQWNQLASDRGDPLTVNVNLSAKQLASSQLIPHIEMLLKRYQLEANLLNLEVTESLLMENSHLSKMALANLKALGVKIYMDDFGTGYSSLSYLHHFPVDALKIDRSFIIGLDQTASSTGSTIAQSIIGLAHNLGVKVVAEGIEKARHVLWLRTFHCDYGQGFFFAKPLTANQATTLVKGEITWDDLRSSNRSLRPKVMPQQPA
jgi:diguanylate cyclase (GGDEF)-like protein